MDKNAVSSGSGDRATGRNGTAVLATSEDETGVAATLALDARSIAHDVTLAHPRARDAVVRTVATTTLGNSVLPCVDAESEARGELRMVMHDRPRFEAVRSLGEGGMGEVTLMRDHDIARQVAFKRLRPDVQDGVTLARFVDEVRTIGRLEHPNIVPIHDVGVDAEQRYFFVMKYVEGETLESIIENLALGDPAYQRRYSYEARIELFLGVLHALEFAHSQGVIHRDLKPANVMVGRFGEVVLMDWGIAKQIGTRDRTASSDGQSATPLDEPASTATRARLASTRHGALIGTPAYMSPEQAEGRNDALDVRSDLYSATVLFHELMGLEHYLAGNQTIHQVLAALLTPSSSLHAVAQRHHPDAPAPPAEIVHFVAKGLARDPAKRFQTATEMTQGLRDILAGRIKVQCYATFTKRMAREAGRLVDRRPAVGFIALIALVLLMLASAVVVTRSLVG